MSIRMTTIRTRPGRSGDVRGTNGPMAGSEPAAVIDDADAPARRWRRRRITLLAIYVTAFAVTTALWGFPASRDRVLVWVLAVLVIAVVGRPHALARLAVDFLPVIAFLYAYDLLRGAADGLFAHVYELPQLRVDEWLFGGIAPTVRLQRALWTPGHPHVWDYFGFIVYLTYFIVPVTVAAVLWRKAPRAFHRYVSLWIGLSFAALATYALYPASPPWLASRHGLLPHVVRITPYMSRHMGVDLTRVMGSQAFVNKVAAVPSLHAATALLIGLFFWSRTTRWRWVLVLYPLAMAASLVYLGEHYVSDVLLGWVYAVVVFVVGNRLYDWNRARRAGRRAQRGGARAAVELDRRSR
jgi:membrane-associated phospholipid phosphatase